MIFNTITKQGSFLRVLEEKEERINNSTFNVNISLIESDYEAHNRNLFVVLPTLFDSTRYYDALSDKYNSDEVLFFPVDETFISSLSISSEEFKFERINTIINLLNEDKKHIIITNINGILRVNQNKESWLKAVKHFKVGSDYNIGDIKTLLISLGYKLVSVTTEPGDFSFRGSIIDFFPISYQYPVRLDFFGDTLDSIKYFRVENQRSFEVLEEAAIYPYQEFFYTDLEKDNLIEYLKAQDKSILEAEVINQHIEFIELRKNLEQIIFYCSYFHKTNSILDYSNNTKIYLVNEARCDSVLAELMERNDSYYKDMGSMLLKNFTLFMQKDEVLNNKNILYIDTLEKTKKALNMKAKEIPSFNGSLETIARELGSHIHRDYVFISLTNLEQIGRLKDYFRENGLAYKTVTDVNEADIDVVNFTTEKLNAYYLEEEHLYIVDQNTLFPKTKIKKKARYKSTFNEGLQINYHNELNIGDYIVHVNHGIGLYEGIKTIDLKGRKRDYLSLLYADNERLYIPIEQLSMIKKYIGSYGRKPDLTKLGSSKWTKQKLAIIKKVQELSASLVKLYSEREKVLGHQYAPDTEEQKQFESDFIYEETPDQLKAIEAVKRDMESPKPMDRLVCGDVGFGKTEVALRAAFKAVMDLMQVCVLAPTTILARQHYYTFKERMAPYGVRVELLNRFVSTKEINRIIKALNEGLVDVVIGTHRLLSEDIKFKNLGLLITDEEQRFGVKHKEKIKMMRTNVDSLMLSATPIPRTLQMSLVGIKELSVIETPPKNRYPVQTYVTPRNDSLIKEAIERELIRHGQVFYLYNFTEDIEEKANEISRLVPEARVTYVHGGMEKNRLERTVQAFIDKEYDVLVSTTIIENGIDIPEANTLIVNDSDRLGLAQMYQIRGRVGRSDKIAYAYFMYEPRKILTEEANKRLDAILEYNELGSGFRVAMRDLAIRGAGDLLGQEQSGFIDTVGLDTYMDILDKELKKQRNQEEENTKPIVGTFKYTKVLSDRFIPDNYLLDESLKIEIHNKINKIKTMEDVLNLEEEFKDRFGTLDESLKIYMYEKLFIAYCNTKGIADFNVNSTLLTIYLTKEKSQTINGDKLFRTAYSLSDDFNLQYKNYQITIFLKLNRYKNNSWLELICRLLCEI